MNKKTQTITGLVGGIVLPMLTLLALYLVRFREHELGTFIDSLLRYRIIGKFLQLAAIPNLLLFFVFLWLDKPYASRGVIGATFILVAIILLFSFVL